jgi:hypothetical protein
MFKNKGLKHRLIMFRVTHLNIIVNFLVGFKPTTRIFFVQPCSLLPAPYSLFGKLQNFLNSRLRKLQNFFNSLFYSSAIRLSVETGLECFVVTTVLFI